MVESNGKPLDMRVLLVEDSPEARDLIEGMLQNLEVAEIVTAEDGVVALDILNAAKDTQPIDLVLCDWHMPRMDGIELLKRIRVESPDLPFVMLTGMADDTAVAGGGAHGATSHMAKPFTIETLSKKLIPLSRLVAHRRRQKIAALGA